MRHRTLDERWRDFEARVIPPDASPENRRRARLVFYAGMAVMNDFITNELTVVPDDVGVARVESVQQELRDFCKAEAEFAKDFAPARRAVRH